MRRRKGHKNQRSDLKTLSCNPLLETRRNPFIWFSISDVERLLCNVCPPRWPLLGWHIGVRTDEALLGPHHGPFDLGGIFLVDDDVELEEVEEFAQLFREDFRQILRLYACGKSFTDSKESLIALPCV